MKARRSIAGMMAALVLCMSVIVPVREAKAVAPVVVGMALVNAAGAVLASDALLSAGTSIIGGLAVAAIFLTPGDSSSVGVAVPLTANATATAAAIPPPVAPASAGAPTVTTMYTGGGTTSSTFGGACSAAVSYQLATAGYGENYSGSALVSGGNCYLRLTYIPGGWSTDYPTTVGTTSVTSCPSGYLLSGGDCVLNQPWEAVSDKRVDLYVGSNGYLSFNSDIDVKPGNVAVGGGDCSGCGRIWGNNAAGEPFVTTITPTVDGGSVIETQTQISSSSGSAVRGGPV